MFIYDLIKDRNDYRCRFTTTWQSDLRCCVFQVQQRRQELEQALGIRNT